MKDFEEILDEVKMYEAPVKLPEPKMVDGIEKNPDVQAIDTEWEKATLWNETDIRNSILKSIGLMGLAVACRYLGLAVTELSLSVCVACLCNICYKFGIYRGRNEE